MDGQLNLFDIHAEGERKPCDYSFERELGMRVVFTGEGTLKGMTGTITSVEPYYTKVLTEWGERMGTPTSIAPAKDEDEEDDLDEALRNCMYQGGKIRVYALYHHEKDPKKRAAFLAEEFGNGWRTMQLKNGASGFVDYNKKGVTISQFGAENETTYKWSDAEKRVALMIDNEDYLTPKELEEWDAIKDPPYPEPKYKYPPRRNTCRTCEHFQPTYVHGGGTGYPVCFVGDAITRSNNPEQEACDDYEEREEEEES